MFIPASHQLRAASRSRIVNLTSHNKTKKLPRLILAFAFLFNGLSYGSVADWFYSSDRDKTHQSYTQNNYACRDEWANCNSPLLGLFSITPQKDFLYGAFTKDTARMWEMNGTLSHDLKTYVAPDINASDYGSVKLHLRQAGHSSWFHRIFSTYGASAVNSEIPKFTVWEQHSFVSGMYEPQKFSNVQMNGNAYKSFDIATARDNWIVRERASDITCDAANRPTSMMLRTYDIAGNVFAQKMDNIVYAQSADAGRRQTMLSDAQSKIEKTEYYGHRQIYDGLIETLDPAKYVPASFNLTTRDPRGNTTNIAFTNVQWKNDAVIGFDAVLDAVPTRNGIATTMHATPVLSNEGQRIGVTVDVTDSAGTRAFTWKADDHVAFKDFAKQIMQGVNPLDIMGSSRVQIGEVKVAWLARGYDDKGYVNNAIKTFGIDYGITHKNTINNTLKQSLFELEQTAPSIVRSELWNSNVRSMSPKELAGHRDAITQKIETSLEQCSSKNIHTVWEQPFSSVVYPQFSMNERHRIVSNNEFVAHDGTKLTNAEFIFKNNTLCAVSGTLVKTDGSREIKEYAWVKPTIEQHNTNNMKMEVGSGLRDDIDKMWGKVTKIAGDVWDGVQEGAKACWDTMKSVVSWVRNVFSSQSSVKTSEVSLKNAGNFLDSTITDAETYVQESKREIVGLIDSTKQNVSDGLGIVKNGAANITNNVISIEKNLSAINNQNVLVTMLYTGMNVQQGAGSYNTANAQLDGKTQIMRERLFAAMATLRKNGQNVTMMENVATLANMQDMKNIENFFQSAKALDFSTDDLMFKNSYRFRSNDTQINLVKTNAEVTTDNLTVKANANVSVGFNGLLYTVSASAQYALSKNSGMSIQYENNTGRETRQIQGGLNYKLGNNTNVIFEINNHWMLFHFNLKY